MKQQLRSTTFRIIDNDDEQEDHYITKYEQQIEIDDLKVTIKSIEEFDEAERKIYEDWATSDERTKLLKASLYYFPYGDTIESDGALMELMDILVLRVANESLKLSEVYYVKENCLTIQPHSHKFYLPTTGSELAEIDFSEEVDKLHN